VPKHHHISDMCPPPLDVCVAQTVPHGHDLRVDRADRAIDESLLNDKSETTTPTSTQRHRVWLSGVVAFEPLSSHLQGQPFANWTRSRLTYQIGIGDEPPAGYTGVEYRILKRTPDTEW
jgi:hypothetical protein